MKPCRVPTHAAVGITTDGPPLCPSPIALALAGAAHQVREFHVRKDPTKAVRRVPARLRERLAEQKPTLGRGRPKNTAEPGEGVDVRGRQPATGDLQRGRAWHLQAPEDAEGGLPCTNASRAGGPDGLGPGARPPG
jgi:hypothetical protein